MSEQETTPSQTLTVEEVLAAAGSGTLNPDQFHALAKGAKDDAENTGGDANAKFSVFSEKLLKNCNLFGDPIHTRFLLVAYPKLVGLDKWAFMANKTRLYYFGTGTDGYRYLAAIWP